MHSTKNLICKAFFFLLLYVTVDSNARRTSQSSNHDNHRRQNGHIYHRARTTSSKRRLGSVMLHITGAMARKSEELRRIAVLNGIVKYLGQGHHSVKIYRRQVPRTKFTHSAVNQYNNQPANGGARMRIVSNKPSRTPNAVFKYFKRLQQQRDAAAASKVCHDMQKLMARQNIRVRTRCTSDPRHISIPRVHTV